MSPVPRALFGGWSFSGIFQWHTGIPFPTSSGNGFAFPTNYYVNGPPTLKPGVSPPVTKVTKNAPGGPNIFPDPEAAYAAFEYTKSGFSGNRNVLHGPGYFAMSAALEKRIAVSERQQIRFRWETFNVTNTVNFDGRVNPVGNSGIDFDLDFKSSFGELRSLAGTPRLMQFALRYEF
jgi:hypothetical protein